MYLLKRVDIKTWSEEIVKESQDDGITHCIKEAEPEDIDKSGSIKRLIFVLKLYNQCINHKPVKSRLLC